MTKVKSLMIVPVLIGMCGCHTLSCVQKDEPVVLAAAPNPEVQVGGLVRKSGVVELSGGVQTLSAVLSIAGLQQVASMSTLDSAGLISSAELTTLKKGVVGLKEAAKSLTTELPPGTQITNRLNEGPATDFTAAEIAFRKSAGEFKRSHSAEKSGSAYSQFAKRFLPLETELLKSLEGIRQNGTGEEAGSQVMLRLSEIETILKESQDDSGETLRANTLLEVSESSLLVTLTRGRARYHLPYPFAKSGPAGEVELRNGDLISVVRIDSTTLQKPVQEAGTQVHLSGLTPRRGVVNRSPDLLNLGSVARYGLAGFSGGDDGLSKMCIVLKRRSLNRIDEDVYVLPYDHVTKQFLSNLPTIAKDRFEYVPYFQAPLIAESIIGRAARDAAATRIDRIEKRTPGPNHHDKKINWLQDKRQSMDRSFHSMMSNLPIGL